MPRHQVMFSIPEKELLRAGIEVEVWGGAKRRLRKLGRLKIRKGSLSGFRASRREDTRSRGKVWHALREGCKTQQIKCVRAMRSFACRLRRLPFRVGCLYPRPADGDVAVTVALRLGHRLSEEGRIL